jgi:Ca2+-transporting ATPase
MDDNFATIVAAVREGRVIYDNIRKFIKYIVTTNASEIWLMLLAPLAGMPLPLLPLQILWMNLMTDGLPALALGVEPAERDVMRRPPQRAGAGVFSEGMGWHIAWVGVLMSLLSLVTGYCQWQAGNPHWQTMVFTTVTVAQLAHAMAIRSWSASLFTQGLMSNKPLAGAVALSFVLQLAVIYLPPCQRVFKTAALSAAELGLCIALASVIFVAVELEKWLRRRRAADNRRNGR